MFIQKDKPEKGDPFFNTASAGGVSTCIVIKNHADGLNTLPNCVSGAVGSFNKAACADIHKPEFKYLNYPPNAENIYEYAQKQGLKVSQSPSVGAIIVWQKGATLKPDDGAGHVAFITSIDADGTIHTSESEYNGRAWVNRTYKPPYVYGSQYKLLGFIYQPQANPYPEPTRALKKGMYGSDVKWMQYELIESGYLRSNELDGSFGTITLGALLAFQFEHSLDVDGVCGAITRQHLKEEY